MAARAGRKHFGVFPYGVLCDEELTYALKHSFVVLPDTQQIVGTGIADLLAMPPRGSSIPVNLAALKASKDQIPAPPTLRPSNSYPIPDYPKQQHLRFHVLLHHLSEPCLPTSTFLMPYPLYPEIRPSTEHQDLLEPPTCV